MMMMKMKMMKINKNKRELYQDGIEGIKGLELYGESKDEKSQMYLENNLNKIENNFPGIYDKYQRFFKYLANKETNDVDYEILLSKVDDINFYDRYGTLYNYLNCSFKTRTKQISMKKINYFWKIYRKGLSLKVSIIPGVKIIQKRLMMIWF